MGKDLIDVARIEGRDSARDADQAAGRDPWNCEGFSMLPSGPLPGDYDYIRGEVMSGYLAGGDIEKVLEAFKAGYIDTIEICRGCRYADKVRAVRRECGLTQAELADRLHVDSNTVARWERRELTPTRLTEAGVMLILDKLRDSDREWARAEHLANEYDGVARDADHGGFSVSTAREVKRVCKNTAANIRREQKDR